MDDADDNQPVPISKKIQEKLARSRFAAFSLLLHVILVIVGATVVVVKAVTDAPDFTSEGGGLVAETTATAAPPEQPPDPSQTQQFEADTPTIDAPQVQAITTTSTAQTNFKMAAIPAPKITAPTDGAKVADISKSLTKGVGKGLPGTMAGRMGGSARSEVMKKNNMKEKTEKAVLAGLRWLKENQKPDGSWGETHHSGMTGLAILCFLGHGELPESPEFGPTVKKGIDWMLASGTQFQGRFSRANAFSNGPQVYEHGIATYAIAEYYTMTKDERVKELVTQAATHIVAGQNPGGGWDYAYAKGVRQDLSVGGWQIQALKAAHLTGLNIAGVDAALDKSMLHLKNFQGDGGGFGYTGPETARYSLTGVGVLCTIFWKGKDNDQCRDGIEYIIEKMERTEPIKYKEKSADLYAWYYNTQAALMYGGSAWTKWNRAFQDEIVDNQSPDGSWPVHGGKGHAPEKEAGGDGPCYRTTLCVLMLESYYRYLPTGK